MRRRCFLEYGERGAAMSEVYDVTVIGGGIVGLATAHELLTRRPALRLLLLEKEAHLGAHQTGRNSGVIHSGIYYRPGSLKAENCRRGRELLLRFCDEEAVPYQVPGKVIVASSEEECRTLAMLEERGRENGVRVELLDRAGLRELEPHAEGKQALHVRDAGIVDFSVVCERLRARIEACEGASIALSSKVTGARDLGSELVIETSSGAHRTRAFVNAAGLHSDRVARLFGARPGLCIVPFRGDYCELSPAACSLVKNLIYPVPNPEFPFLGVHLTRHLDGRITCGPSATLVPGREAYDRAGWNGRELGAMLAYGGFWRMLFRYRKLGVEELALAYSREKFTRLVQRLVPEIQPSDLLPGPSGIRAQAVASDGRLLDDFEFGDAPRGVHVYNAPSPAATASLNIAKVITDRLEPKIA